MSDKFFTQPNCERCGATLKGRIMSWFKEETICTEKCGKEESELKAKLSNGGRDHEGCGYIPKV